MTERPISFRERKDIIDAIDELADKLGTDRSAIIRQLIREHLRSQKKNE